MPQVPANSNVVAVRARPDVAFLLFLTLLGTYAYFWQSRDWNTATRLMLTYSLGDRRLVEIDGLEEQCGHRDFNFFTGRSDIVAGDIARVGSHFYTDKAPGQSLLGVPVYLAAKLAFGLRDHPLDVKAIQYWPSDYFVTLGTSGVMTAALAVVIYAFALRLGTSHIGGVLLGLAYGLATPALVYGTLFYGHQAAAFCTLSGFFLLYRAAHEGRANLWNMLLAGLLAGYAVVAEYQTAGISAVLGVYAIVAIRRVRPVFIFACAAALAASLLAAYNYRAFGHPLELSYAHEVSREFQAVHSKDNPLGLALPAWDRAHHIIQQLLWGEYRGLAFYASVTLGAPLGLLALIWRRYWGVALVTLDAAAWMLFVNVSYPLWEGGMCTGPRFILPALPFLVLALAGLVGSGWRWLWTTLLAPAVVAGGLLMIACVAVGGRFPPGLEQPIREKAVPQWLGEIDPVDIPGGRQFEWNLGRWLFERFMPADVIPAEPSPWQSLQIAPLGVYLIIMIGVLLLRSRSRPTGVLGNRSAVSVQPNANRMGTESKP
jgi:hypothetical protein